ncbi:MULTISPECIES: DNA primase [Rhodobacterales]|jgi:DNA primase|uniref:DNA primase n=1 Tax=Rhodobacterales TaxID=204455 RepID=UPI00237FCC52|nr:DNA primase [Phaeobacter gallaeciensis]MDE4142022.1 DNA primase [Phaeobacter gallaeciensis]MDE4150467.1 DNA primase [Phaeobacter gallaeciensis]MDE4154690.1 DNA primase [Phaeobacter gallaeciensis]MDE4230081.1 DNA primase [Phaeobacter gallaeciensis]MDE4259160.1 DNA primase [Phaeobacter gallaeciensis]
MSLPPGFLDELRTRTSLTAVVGRKVMWDQRKSNMGKGDMWAPCPFHHEKSASFHVDDRKGFYYCFGCQAKGDALKFVQETENVGFMEAVEILAGEAGMEMPRRDPQAQQKQDRRSQLAEVMEQAVQFFRLQLNTQGGTAARAYLAGRGLTGEALERWQIGFAPDGWQGLWDHLRGKSVPEDLIMAAGLAKPSSKGGKPYDTFRNRIMFPIRDARGRAIAFGGRAMDPNDNAKYLNSPETELFDKGRSLYNHGPARAAAGRDTPLIVAEGYMDVIALSEGGFASCVAPLGTAITENQLQMLWRMSDEPVIALDGDKAGIRAAMRLIDLALPRLEAGKSLRFAIMPEGKDPDDMIRSEGPAAVQAVLDQAMPMVKLLWQRETEGRVFDSPERKAALDKALREKIRLIRDPSIRQHYGEDIKELRWQLFRGNRPQRSEGFSPTGSSPKSGRGFRDGARPPWRGPGAVLTPLASTRSSLLAGSDEAGLARAREAVILATVITTPAVVHEFETNLERMLCTDPDLAALRDMVLRYGIDAPERLKEEIEYSLGPHALENLFALRHVAIIPCLRKPGDAEAARLTLAEEFPKLEALRGLDAELAEAEEDLSGLADEALTWRLKQAAEARNRAVRSENEDRAQYDVGENGARLDREERDAFGALLDRIGFSEK